MFEGWKLTRERKNLELQELKYLSGLFEQLQGLEETLGSVAQFDPDEEKWLLVGGTGPGGRDMRRNLSYWRDKSRLAFRKNPHAKGAIQLLRRFVIGRGMPFVAVDSGEPVRKFLRQFIRENRWRKREKEIVRRAFRDGDVFLRKFREQSTGMTFLRFVEPENVRDPGGSLNSKYLQGIRTDPDDAETPIEYRICKKKSQSDYEDVPAEEIHHIKIETDMATRRGVPLLVPILEGIDWYQTWLKYRMILNKMRSAIALIRKHTGTPGQIAAFRTAKTTRTDAVDRARQKFYGGTILDAPVGMDYEFKSPNIDSRDAQADGRAVLLTMAVGVGLAEYMMSGDSSNANYSSIMVAESPPVRTMEDWQDTIILEFEEIFRDVILYGMVCGKLPTNTNPDVQFIPPSLITRNRKEDIEGDEVLLSNRLMSPQTMSEHHNLDPEIEAENWKQWEEKYGRPEAPVGEEEEEGEDEDEEE